MSYVKAEYETPTPLVPLDKAGLDNWQSGALDTQASWVEASGFAAKPGEICLVPAADGSIDACLFGKAEEGYLYQLAGLPSRLPKGAYRLESDWNEQQRSQAALGWGLACYKFSRYCENEDADTRVLVLEEDIEHRVHSLLEAQNLVRDLVNTPTEDLGPQQLEDAVRSVAQRFDADVRVIRGDDLLSENFPAIHAVGRASHRPPRLIEMTWGDKKSPLLALVGKGVCFDTGGLNLKPTAGMALMKKDMGGAAHALGTAQLVMAHELPVRLKLLIPAVENSVSGNSYRPGDVIPTRKGLSVEIGNTDAEGRVILSDALTYASEMKPEVIIDFATLTGAARIAMGTDLPPLFSNDDSLSAGIQVAGDACEDPLWTLPLWQPYKELIKSKIADINNNARTAFGGCITAALFLEHFVDKEDSWAHIDTFAWNQANRPGRPEGGEALSLRAVFTHLEERFKEAGN
jgi:leucyl aminopeptidase